MNKFNMSLLAFAAALSLGGCISSQEVIFPEGGDRVALLSNSYVCGLVTEAPKLMQFREIDKGAGMVAYVPKNAPPGSVEYSFRHMDGDRYLVVLTARESDGTKTQAMLPAQVSNSSLTAVMPKDEKLELTAGIYGVEIENGYGFRTMRGTPEAKRAFVQEIASGWEWKEVEPYFSCRAAS